MLAEIMIAWTGVTAIWLSQDLRFNVRRWACVVAMIGQPFWFIAMYDAKKYVIMILCCAYTFGWCRGVYNHWIKPMKREVE